MSTLEKAIEIASQSHAGVLDKQGEPYILHPLRVMLNVRGLSAQVVAVLHDVVEDTDVTLEDIRNAGFSEDVVTGLALVTHKREMSYADYVIGCKQNAIAQEVKLSDLRENTRLDRALMRADRFADDTSRMQRYILSYQFLKDELPEPEYRKMMAAIEGS